ncbi:MAG: hypothetical protein COW58_08100 [Thalassolituus sp. CG17_big_fil_post_rev_8_21_14_2_50_53_8]|nr:MAG: hypothetical protein COW58_08100 [Thalassolituus sp. CG17_big_fil_post_rev_8_21_14_2_50_53_8]
MNQKSGRPRKDPVEKYRVQSWFNFVSENGLRSAYELEQEFSPQNFKKDDDGNTTYPCTWAKYRSGKITPSESLLARVEELYPGSRAWFNHPIWRLLAQKPPSSDFLKASIAPVKPRLAKIIGEYDPTNSYRNLSSEHTYKYFYEFDLVKSFARYSQKDSVDKLIGALALLVDSEKRQCRMQNIYSHHAVICNIDIACKYLAYIEKEVLLECIYNRFSPTEYFNFISYQESVGDFSLITPSS